MIKFSIVQKLNKLFLEHSDNPERILTLARENNLQAIGKTILKHEDYFFDKETEIGSEISGQIIIENSINVISEKEIKSLKKLVHDLELNYDYAHNNSETLKQITEILNPQKND